MTIHPFLEQELQQGGLLLVREFQAPLEKIVLSHADAEVLIIRSRMKVDRNFMNQFPMLKVIGRLGAGLENIDVHEAERRGITCLRVPEGNARAVAEHALGMLLGLLNHFPRAHTTLKVYGCEPNKGRASILSCRCHWLRRWVVNLPNCLLLWVFEFWLTTNTNFSTFMME